MKSFYNKTALLLLFFFLFVAALQAQTYQPVVTNGDGNCSAEATYNYNGDHQLFVDAFRNREILGL